jgi:hypothetical protein
MTEHTLITPRRNFLIRALGFTAAGATLSIPVVLADSPQKRVEHHLQELNKALQEIYPEQRLLAAFRPRSDFEMTIPDVLSPDQIVATVRSEGRMHFPAD